MHVVHSKLCDVPEWENINYIYQMAQLDPPSYRLGTPN